MATEVQNPHLLPQRLTQAQREASICWQDNLAAIRLSQPRLVQAASGELVSGEWVFARDGSLTLLEESGSWWAGCSLPKRAAAEILKTLEGSGRVSCFLSPPYAAQVRFALDRLGPEQAIIAICPDVRALSVILGCEDFAAAIRAHRLWFAWGSDWAEEMRRLLVEQPGLPTPAQFIRGAAADKSGTDVLIPRAQAIFAQISSERQKELNRLSAAWMASSRERPRICVVAPSHFRLWDDAGHALHQSMMQVEGDAELIHFDGDDPASASPLALARAVDRSDAIVSVGLGRADLGDAIVANIPWIQWQVNEKILPRVGDGSRDLLLVAELSWREKAVSAGWDAERVQVAQWPAAESEPAGDNGALTLIADMPSEKPPAYIADFSSQQLLWDAIGEELRNNPFALFPSPSDYIASRRNRMRIAEEGFDDRLFLELLVYPAFREGLVRLLRREGIEVRIFGKGWGERGIDAVPVATRGEMSRVLQTSSALIDPSPGRVTPQLQSAGRSILSGGVGRSMFLNGARRANSQSRWRVVTAAGSCLSGELILSEIQRLRGP